MDEAAAADDDGTDVEDEISLSLCLSIQCYEDGQYEEAVHNGKKCLEMATEKDNQNAVMTACLVIGGSEFELKEYEDAVSHCMTSMELATKSGDVEVEMKTCLTLAKAHYSLGHGEETHAYAWRCIEIAKEIASGLLYEGKAFLVLSEVYCTLTQEYEYTIDLGMRALNIAKEIGDIHTEMKSCRIIAEAYKALKVNDESLEYAWCIDVANDKQVTMKACYVFMTNYESLKQYEKAIYYAEICLGFAKEMGNKRAELETLRFIAGTQVDADNHTEAVRYAQMCLEFAKETKDKREEMDACYFIANTQCKAGNFTEAVRYAEMCLEFAKETKDKREEMDACYVIGNIQCQAGNFTEAVRYVQMCLEFAKETKDKREEMDACFVIANIQCQARNFTEAVRYAKLTLELATEAGHQGSEVKACKFLIANCQHVAGNSSEAIHYAEMCLEFAKEIRDKHKEMDACYLIADIQREAGNFSDAVRYAKLTLELATEAGDQVSEVKACKLIAICQGVAGNSSEAIHYAEMCLEFAKEIRDKHKEMDACYLIANIQRKAGNFTEAVRYAKLTLELATETGYQGSEVKACKFLIANCQHEAGNSSEAIHYAEMCLEFAKEIRDKHEEMDTCHLIANIQCQAGNFTEAVRYAEMCLEFAKETKDKREEMDACYVIANIQCQARNFTEAVRYAKLTLELATETGYQGSEVKACKFLIANCQHVAGNSSEAIHYAEMCLEFAKEIRDKHEEMDACYLIANIQRKGGNFSEAVRYAKLTLELATEAGDQVSEVKACELIAICQGVAGNSSEAIHYAEMCLEFAKEIRDKHEEMDACYLIANIQCQAGNFTEVVKYGLMWADLATEIGDKQSEIEACFLIGNAGRALETSHEILQYATKRMTMEQESNEGSNKKIGCFLLGLVHYNMNKYEDALSHLKQAIDHAREDKDEYGEMKIYYWLEVTHCHLQQIDNAISCCEKSIQIAKKIDANEWEMNRSLRLAQLYKTVNRNDQVELHATVALEIAKKLGDKEIQRNANICLGDLYRKSGQDSKATACFNRSADIAKETGNTFTKIFATVLDSCSSLSEAKKRMEKNQDMLKGFSLPLDRMTETDLEGVFSIVFSIHDFWMLLIKSCADYDSTEVAIHFIEKMMQQLKPQNGLEFSAQPLIHLLEKSMNVLPLKAEEKTAVRKLKIHLAENEKSANTFAYSSEEILLTFRKVSKIILELNKVLGDVFSLQATCHSIIGMTHYLLNDVPNAKASFIEATKCFESLFNGVGVDKSKISIVDRYADIYKLLSIILIQEGKTEEALAMAENCRAKALKDILMYGLDKEVFREDRIEFDDILPVLKVQKSSVLFYTLSFHGIHKFVMEDEKDLQFSAQPLVQPDLRFKNLVKEVYKELKVSDGFRCSSTSWVSRITQFLEQKDEINRETWTILTREFLGKIAPQCGLNVGDLEEFGWEKVGDFLKEMMMDFYFEDPGYERVEENNTPYPFEAIEGKSSFTSALDALSHRLLDNVSLEQDEVVIIPDGLISIVPFAALTNPATGNYLSEDKKIRFAPSLTTLKMLSESREDFHTLKGAILIGDPDVSSVLCDGEPLTQLSNAEIEVTVIASKFNAEPLTGAQATKRAVLEKLREGASVVHIAAHGHLDKATILLAPDPEVEVPDEKDYMLTMADVQQAQVRAQLVVLSCCYSGRGEIRAEGAVGMCRAFLASGARAVVATLWAIDDEATLEFMQEFYDQLKHESASTSLQMAMKEMRENEMYNEPKYWAPFFLMGDDVKVKF